MAITAGGRLPNLNEPSSADQVTVTRARDGGFAVECLRGGSPEVSTFPDIATTLDYVANELGGGEPGPPMDAMGPPPGGPPPMPEEMV